MIANSAKTNIDVSLKNPHLKPKNIFKNNTLSEESANLCFLVTFNIIIS